MTEFKKQETLIDPSTLEDSIGAKGVSFDPEVLYTFTTSDVKFKQVQSAGEGGHEGKTFTVVETQNTEEESDASIRMSFFYNKKVIINEQDKEKESDAVKFARGLGYPVGLGMPFKWKEVFRVGTKFTAHVKPQIDRKTKQESGYFEIDLTTVKGVKGATGAKATKQASVSISDSDRDTIIGMAAGVANKTALITLLNSTKMPHLINPAMQMDAAGQLTYGQ